MNRSRQAWADRLLVVIYMVFFAIGHWAPSRQSFPAALAVGFVVMLAASFVVGFANGIRGGS